MVMTMSESSNRCSVAVVAFHGVIPFHLSVPCFVFGAVASPSVFDVVVCAGESGKIRTTAGFGLTDLASIKVLETADAIIVPGWREELDAPPPRLLAALKRAHDRGAELVGLCLGTYVLAAAGLLEGRRATTHWECIDELSSRFPSVHMEPDVLYVEDCNILTSAGTAASLDVCLHVLRKRLGATVANRTARRLVVAPHRDGGQGQIIEQPLPETSGDCRLTALLNSVRTRLQESHTVDALAREARMSRRSFTRHFRALTGTSAANWLLKERLHYSQRLLESSDSSVDAVADAAGFGSVASFRRHFREAFGFTPTVWREQFQNPRERSAVTTPSLLRGRAAARLPGQTGSKRASSASP